MECTVLYLVVLVEVELIGVLTVVNKLGRAHLDVVVRCCLLSRLLASILVVIIPS